MKSNVCWPEALLRETIRFCFPRAWLCLWLLALAWPHRVIGQALTGPIQMGPDIKPATSAGATKAIPLSFLENVASVTSVLLPAPDLSLVLKEDQDAAGKDKTSRRVGIKRSLPVFLEFVPQKAASLKPGGKLWVATIESQTAVSIRVHFTKVSLPDGAWIQVYNALDPRECRGPFDGPYIKGRADFWSLSVFGAKVVVECFCPPQTDPSTIQFTIGEITHRYVKLSDPEDLLAKAAGACNNDITCSPAWQQISRAVARIGLVRSTGEFLCSGCLLNDADSASFVDYFLTANHCVANQIEANDAEFFWLFQTSVCNGAPPTLSSVPLTGGGGDYLGGATRSLGNDFTFLRLRQQAPGGATFAGWSVSAPGSGETLSVIHHPSGDFKRISFGSLFATASNFWQLRWNSGTTEPGSSGAPLFNASQQVIGQLFGGPGSCSNPLGVDEFGRFDKTFPLIQNWLQSQPIVLTNDTFAKAQNLIGSSGTVSASSAGATKEVGEPPHAGNDGGLSVWFRWIAPSADPVVFDTLGSGFDTLLAVYLGSAVTDLTLVGSNDDVPGKSTSQVQWTPQAGAIYSIAVDGYDGAGGAIVLNWITNVSGLSTNDNFGSAQVLTGNHGTVTGFNTGASKEPGEPNHAGNVGGASVWYRWTAPSNTLLTVDTRDSAFDTLLAVYTGGTVSNLTLIATNDDYFFYGSRSQVSFNAVVGTTYFIAVDGYDNDQGRVTLGWNTPPSNDRFVGAQTIQALRGEVSNLTTGASKESGEPNHAANLGGKSIWYRWIAPASGVITFDTEGSGFDTLLAVYTGGSVSSLSTVTNNDDINTNVVQSRVTFPATAGSAYFVAVDGYRDSAGHVPEGFALLTWYPPSPAGAPPTNDNFAAAQLLPAANGSIIGTNVRATQENGEPNHDNNDGGKSVWYLWTAPTNGLVTFETSGSDFDTVLAAYSGTLLTNLTALDSNDDIANTSRVSRVSFPVAVGAQYHVAVDGLQTASGTVREGTLDLTWSFLAGLGGNDMFAGAQVLSGASGSTAGSNQGATEEPGEPDHAGNAGGRSVWYRWTASADGPVVVDCLGSVFDTLLAVYRGSSPSNLTLIAQNDDVELSTVQSLVSFAAVAGKEYLIAVDGYRSNSETNGASGSILLRWNQPAGTRPTLAITRPQAPGDWLLIATGAQGATYAIESSTNLLAWTFLTNIVSGVSLPLPDPSTNPQRSQFYRAKAISP